MRTLRHLTVLAAGLLTCVRFGTGPVRAQERFSEQIEVSEIEVPVRVLLKGKPVAGLQKDDFELLDEGEPQTIVGFRVMETMREVALPAAAPAVGLDAAPAGRRLLLVFDFSYTRPQRLANALRDIRSSLERQLGAADRVAVATYGYVSGINLLVGFTRDSAKLDLAFDAIDAMLAAKGRRQREVLGALHDARFRNEPGSSTYQSLADELGAAAALAVLTGPVEYDEEEDDGVTIEEQKSIWSPIQLRVEVDVRDPVVVAQDLIGTDVDTSAIRHLGLALTELTTLLRDVDGQKEMVLISEGFSGPLLENARSQFYLQKAFRAFRDSGWTMHAIDVGGVPGLGEAGFASNSLFFMTEATGGDLIENINNFSVATQQVLKRTAIVYVLSFQPQDPGEPGRFRQLSVRLRNPPKGVQILHRPGYYAQQPPADRGVFEQRMDGVQWLVSNLEADEIGVEVYGTTVSDPLGGIRVPVAVEISGAGLADIETEKATRIGLQLLVLDADQRVREVLSGEVKIRFGEIRDIIERGGLRFIGDLAVPPGSYQLRVLVRSSRKGQVFLETFPLTVGSDVDSQLQVPPTEAERQPSDWLTIETESRAAYFQ